MKNPETGINKILFGKNARILKILPYIITILVIVWLYNNYQRFSLEKIISCPIELLLLIFVIYLLYISLGVISSLIVFSNWNYKINIKTFLLVSFASGVSNYLGPMKFNQILKIYLQKKVMKLPYNISSSGKLLLMIIDFVIIGIISSFYFIRIEKYSFLSYFFLLCITVFVLVIIYSDKLKINFKNNMLNRIFTFIHKTFNNLKEVKLSTVIPIIGISLIKKLLSVLSTFFIIMFFAKSISFWDILVIQSFSTFLGIISLMPMGLGVKDISFIEILKTIGITQDISFAVVVIERFIWTLIPITFGLISLFYISRKYNLSNFTGKLDINSKKIEEKQKVNNY